MTVTKETEETLMIMKRIKCPKCGKYLLQGYSYAVIGVSCTCGHYVDLKNGRIQNDGEGNGQPRKPKKKKGSLTDDYDM